MKRSDAERSTWRYGSWWQALIFWELPLGMLQFAKQDFPTRQQKKKSALFPPTPRFPRQTSVIVAR
jgi:hypothetical protein